MQQSKNYPKKHTHIQLDRAMTLLGLALYLPSVSVSLIFVLYIMFRHPVVHESDHTSQNRSTDVATNDRHAISRLCLSVGIS